MRTQNQMIRDYEVGVGLNLSDDKYSYLCDDDIDETPEFEIKPVSWEEFKSYTENERRYYLSELRRMFNVPQSEISLFLTGKSSSLSAYLSTNGPKGIFSDAQHKSRKSWDKDGWYAFIGKESPEEEPKEEPSSTPSANKTSDVYTSGKGKMLAMILSSALQNDKNYEVVINEI